MDFIVNLLPYAAVAVFFFLVGAAVGAHNVPSVTKAITALKGAEQSAQDTLAKITAHKAS